MPLTGPHPAARGWPTGRPAPAAREPAARRARPRCCRCSSRSSPGRGPGLRPLGRRVLDADRRQPDQLAAVPDGQGRATAGPPPSPARCTPSSRSGRCSDGEHLGSRAAPRPRPRAGSRWPGPGCPWPGRAGAGAAAAAGRGSSPSSGPPRAPSWPTSRAEPGPGLVGCWSARRGPAAGRPRSRGHSARARVHLGVGAGHVGADLDQLLGVAVRGQQPAQRLRRRPAARSSVTTGATREIDSSTSMLGKWPAVASRRSSDDVAVEDRAGGVGDRLVEVVALDQHGVEAGDRLPSRPGRPARAAGAAARRPTAGSPRGRRRLAGRQADLALGHGDAGEAVHQQQDVLALVAEPLGDPGGGEGAAQPHDGRVRRRSRRRPPRGPGPRDRGRSRGTRAPRGRARRPAASTMTGAVGAPGDHREQRRLADARSRRRCRSAGRGRPAPACRARARRGRAAGRTRAAQGVRARRGRRRPAAPVQRRAAVDRAAQAVEHPAEQVAAPTRTCSGVPECRPPGRRRRSPRSGPSGHAGSTGRRPTGDHLGEHRRRAPSSWTSVADRGRGQPATCDDEAHDTATRPGDGRQRGRCSRSSGAAAAAGASRRARSSRATARARAERTGRRRASTVAPSCSATASPTAQAGVGDELDRCRPAARSSAAAVVERGQVVGVHPHA